MKLILLLLIICLMTSCNNSAKKQTHNTKTKTELVFQSDTLGLDIQIKSFETKYKNIVKELYDSISIYKPEDNDFSDITGGLEKKFKTCNKEIEKTLIGFKLAENYYIHFESSKKNEFRQKAEPLFYSFISFKNGEVASRYLKLDLKKVQFLQKKWNEFSETDKETILLYGLLRGFDDGLPDILKNIK
jgi:hypothetical protein